MVSKEALYEWQERQRGQQSTVKAAWIVARQQRQRQQQQQQQQQRQQQRQQQEDKRLTGRTG